MKPAIDQGQSESTCEGCGASLPFTRDARLVTCTYCAKTQPNPRPFLPGQEVLVPNGDSLAYARVTACHGPDRIEFEINRGRAERSLEALIPVLPPTPDLPPGQRVYVDDGLLGWHASRFVKWDGAMCFVKHQHKDFQSSFFDNHVPTASVRVPMRAEDLGERRSPGFLGWRSWTTGKWVLAAGVTLVAAVVFINMLMSLFGD